jgi:putative inorganic carbon (hco3(-)) transporter
VAVSAQERLAFSFQATVPSRHAVATEPTFATAPYSEPRDWGYTGLLLFTAVLMFRPQDDIPALAPLRIAEVCALIGIAPMVLHRLAHRLPVFRVTRETMGLFALGAVMLFTVPFSIWPGGAVTTFFETFFKVVVVFTLMMNTLTTPRRIERITWLMVLAITYIAARGVFDYARGVNLIEGGRLAGAVGGIFGNPNDLALNMVSILPLAVMAALSRRYSLFWRGAAAVAVVLMIATVIFTKSRGGSVGLVVVMVALLFLSRVLKPSVGIAVLAGSLLITPLLPGEFWTRMATIFDSQQDAQQFTGSREARATLLKEGLHTFAEYPLTGVGMGQFRNYNWPGRVERWREAHNVLIQVAADVGVFGLIAFSFLIYQALRTALVMRRQLGPQHRRRAVTAEVAALTPDDRDLMHSHFVAMSAGLIGWFVCAMFASVAYAWTFYYLLALTVAGRELILDRVTGRVPATGAEIDTTRRLGVRGAAEPVTP